jgi:hypothetical protein
MRENRKSGSEGGVAETPPFLPLSNRGRARVSVFGLRPSDFLRPSGIRISDLFQCIRTG